MALCPFLCDNEQITGRTFGRRWLRDTRSRLLKGERVMPRYFFHVMDGRASIDHEGTELAGIEEARSEAIRTAGEILRHDSAGVWTGHPWQMTVADDTGLTKFTLRFSARDHAR